MPTFPRDPFHNVKSEIVSQDINILLPFAVNRDCTAIQAQLPAAAKIRFLLL